MEGEEEEKEVVGVLVALIPGKMDQRVNCVRACSDKKGEEEQGER
jgi:hypothetical protein